MNVFHLSAECYPAAKVGGLADVVGSLPKYLRKHNVEASVVMPKYQTEWFKERRFEKVFEGKIEFGGGSVRFNIQKETGNILGFPLYVIEIPEYFDRDGIYVDPTTGDGYYDEAERFISFQRAALLWIHSLKVKPDVIHCHDHHTGLIPFMMTQCRKFKPLNSIPTVLTVHNAEYQGIYGHDTQALLPDFNVKKVGLLDWDGKLNSLATGLKCCWQITTVSPSYMEELRQESNGLELLFAHEEQKSRGILNGIDIEVWNPGTDRYLEFHYSEASLEEGKVANKEVLCEQFNFKKDRPLISFIGRLVGEKGADLLPDLFTSIFDKNKEASFLVLGTGNPHLHQQFNDMSDKFVGFFDASLTYNEKLAHQIYAGSDFMVMPSRVEPCGLNQMYAMQYGTIPVVHNIGGLKDTVRDIEQAGGYGITFKDLSLESRVEALERALNLYGKQEKFMATRKTIMQLDFSWNVSAEAYIEMYNQLIN